MLESVLWKMSEEKKPLSQADQRVQAIMDKMEALRVEMKAELDKIKIPATPSSKEEHKEDPLEHIHNCPTCKKKLDEEKDAFAKEVMQKTLKERATYPVVCKGCGLGVKEDEKTCPNCGSTEGKYR
jgi:rRNA maturation endonuclease Nob1